MPCPACGDTRTAAGSKFCEACGASMAPPDSLSNPHRLDQAVDAQLALVSDIGRRHSRNEDCGTVARGVDGRAVLVVADGVSTSFHPAGAAATTTRIVRERLLAEHAPETAPEVMRQAIAEAHAAVMALPAGDDPDLDGPECTVVAAMVRGSSAVIGWVGDSRAYLVSATGDRQITVDDSWVEEVVKAGMMTRAQASTDRRSHCVTGVVGMKPEPLVIHTILAEIAQDEVLLLCSDGLWNYFQQPGSLARKISGMRHALGPGLTSQLLCHGLVEAAIAQGGHDNITVATLLAS